MEHVAAPVRLRAELADLAASRQRIVELGDAESSASNVTCMTARSSA